MLELTLSTATPAGNIQMKAPISKVLIDAIMTFNDTTFPDAADAFISQFSTATVEVIRNGEMGGARTLINTVPIADIAEIAARNEGYVKITKLTSGVAATARVQFSVELNNFGSIDANNSNFVRLNLTGFINTNTKFYSKSSPFVNDNFIKYESLGCQAASETVFDVAGKYAIAVPKTLSVIEITYPTGNTERIYPEELDLCSADLTEIVFLVDGRVTSFKNWFVYDVSQAVQVKVTLNTSGIIYLLSNNSFED